MVGQQQPAVPSPRTPGEEQAEESQVPGSPLQDPSLCQTEAGRQHLAAPCTPPQAALDREAAEPEAEADWVARLHAEQSWLVTDRPEDLAAQAE